MTEDYPVLSNDRAQALHGAGRIRQCIKLRNLAAELILTRPASAVALKRFVGWAYASLRIKQARDSLK